MSLMRLAIDSSVPTRMKFQVKLRRGTLEYKAASPRI